MSIKFVAPKPNTKLEQLIDIRATRGPFAWDRIRHQYDADRRRAIVVDFKMRTVSGSWLIPGEDRGEDCFVSMVRDDVKVKEILDTLEPVRGAIWKAMVDRDETAWADARTAIESMS
jgi:hypothetical protein